MLLRCNDLRDAFSPRIFLPAASHAQAYSTIPYGMLLVLVMSMSKFNEEEDIMGQKAKKTGREEQNTHGSSRETQGSAAPAKQGGNNVPANIQSKLDELESEWSLEKIKKVAAAGFVLLGVFLTVKNRKKVEDFGTTVASMLGIESLEDFVPPKGLLDKFGIRLQEDIDKDISKLRARLA